jgi:hypothetical protein
MGLRVKTLARSPLADRSRCSDESRLAERPTGMRRAAPADGQTAKDQHLRQRESRAMAESDRHRSRRDARWEGGALTARRSLALL